MEAGFKMLKPPVDFPQKTCTLQDTSSDASKHTCQY